MKGMEQRMQVIETLLNKRWILKSKEKELYYQVKDEIDKLRILYQN